MYFNTKKYPMEPLCDRRWRLMIIEEFLDSMKQCFDFFFFFFFNSIWLILSLTIKNAYPTYITYNAVLTLLTIQYDHLRY